MITSSSHLLKAVSIFPGKNVPKFKPKRPVWWNLLIVVVDIFLILLGWGGKGGQWGEGRGALSFVILRPSQSDPSQPKPFFILSHCSRQPIRYRFWWLPSEATFSLLRQPEYFQFSLWFGRLRLSSAQLLCRRWRFHITDCTNTQGLKITMENVLPFLWHLVNHNHYNFLTNHSVIVIDSWQQ